MSMLPHETAVAAMESSHADVVDAGANIEVDHEQDLNQYLDAGSVGRALSAQLGDEFVCIDGHLNYFCAGDGYGVSLVMDVATKRFQCVLNQRMLPLSNATPDSLMNVIAELANFAKSTLAISSIGAYFPGSYWWSKDVLRTDLTVSGGAVYVAKKPHSLVPLHKIVFDIGSAKSELARLNNKITHDLRTKTDELKEAHETQSQMEHDLSEAYQALEKTREALNKRTRRLNKVQRDMTNVEATLQSTKSKLASTNSRVSSLREEKERMMAAYDAQVRKLTEDNRRVQDENDRWFDELTVARRETEKLGRMEKTYGDLERQIDDLKKSKRQLLHENSVLRDKISDMRGGSMRVASMFWTKEEVENVFIEIKKQRHYNLLIGLEDLGVLDLPRIRQVLWEILFAVGQKCRQIFADVENVLSIGESGPFRNEIMTKIRDYFEQVLKVEEILDAVRSQFADVVGDMVWDQRFEKYVELCAKLCWVLVIKDDPKMDFDWECGDQIGQEFMKVDFEANFELEPGVAHKKAKCFRLVEFVLPGLREVETGNFVVKPCVVADVVDVRYEETSAMGVDEKEKDGDFVGDEDTVQDSVLTEDIPSDGADGRATKYLEDEKEKISQLLGEGETEEAFALLKQCGFDMQSGQWAIQLTCADCASDLGKMRNWDDQFGCDTNIQHDEVEFEMVEDTA